MIGKKRRNILFFSLVSILLLMFIFSYYKNTKTDYVNLKLVENNVNIKFRTKGNFFEIYNGKEWKKMFVRGVNLGATVPGHFPGELPIQKEDYLRWFKQIQEMGANTIRVYTLHQPVFYDSLVEFNRAHKDNPLYLMQGIWSPEDELIEFQNAYIPKIREKFRDEIEIVVRGVYGDLTLPHQYGAASGKYTSNVGPYLIGWHLGTEWDPEMVVETNELNKHIASYEGEFFSSTSEASPFEIWLAEMIDHAAQIENEYGWHHPMAFTNWVTTDVLSHPGEPLVQEDMVSVYALHIAPNERWQAGYFAAFHVYPFYPDFFLYDKTFRTVKNKDGEIDSYLAYLQRLKEKHPNIPLMVTEYGVPSSLGVSHRGLLGRNQGGHDEHAQGKINADLTKLIYEEDYAGAIVFMWQDEWFKRTWNTMSIEIPEFNPLWFNVLTNEQHFGILGMFSSKNETLLIDGYNSDWETLPDDQKMKLSLNEPGFERILLSHDEAYVYVAIDLEEEFQPQKHMVMLGVDTLTGGNQHSEWLPERRLDEGLEELIKIGLDEETEMLIASNYDLHNRLYGKSKKMINVNKNEWNNDSGIFNPWKLALSLKLEPPDTKFESPFMDVIAGQLIRGSTDREDEDYNSLATWQYNDNFIELRIPWLLLGVTDPSKSQVISYDDFDRVFKTVEIEGIHFVPWIYDKQQRKVIGLETVTDEYPVSQIEKYSWENWEKVNYIERLKESYYYLQEVFLQIKENE